MAKNNNDQRFGNPLVDPPQNEEYEPIPGLGPFPAQPAMVAGRLDGPNPYVAVPQEQRDQARDRELVAYDFRLENFMTVSRSRYYTELANVTWGTGEWKQNHSTMSLFGLECCTNWQKLLILNYGTLCHTFH